MTGNIQRFPKSPALPVLEGADPKTILARLDKHRGLESTINRLASWKPDRDLEWNSIDRIERGIAEINGLLAGFPRAPEVVAFGSAIRGALERRTASSMADEVADLISAFPNFNAADPEGFARLLLGDLADEGIADAVAFQAFRDLRRSARFMPAIAEVIATAKAIESRWSGALRNAEGLQAKRTEIEAALRTATTRLKERSARGDAPRQLPTNVLAAMRGLRLSTIDASGGTDG